jgi:hypothetical protein
VCEKSWFHTFLLCGGYSLDIRGLATV